MDTAKDFMFIALLAFIYNSNACTIEGISTFWVDISVVDTDRGVVFSGATTDIQGISSSEHSGDGLNFGPYFTPTLENSQFTLTLHENFALYEEYETSQSMSYLTTFTCTTGNLLSIVFIVSVIDTNNNAPTFSSSNEISFVVSPPLAPGYQITGCGNAISVRDIDLTTQRLVFAIEENPYFEIAYNDDSTTESKNFEAILQTLTLIRSLPEPVILTINATDVDLTGDPPLTTTITLRIEGDSEFQYPDEPVFSQPFYLASYSEDHQLTIPDTIYLQQGYDQNVEFSLSGEYSGNFLLSTNGNQVLLEVETQLLADLLAEENQLYLVVAAENEYTSGATATIIVQLPQARDLSFAETVYTGQLDDGVLTLVPIFLTVGYSDDVGFTLQGDYATYFTVTNDLNEVSVTLSTPLSDAIIEDNDYIVLALQASGDNGATSTATIIVDIIKEDVVPPVFTSNNYKGSFVQPSAIEIETISLSQGYDDSVSFRIEGEHSQYFSASFLGNAVTLSLLTEIPEEVIFSEKVLVFQVIAEKPLTVGANSAITITFPQELTDPPELIFEKSSYVGALEENVLTLENIVLESGYATGTEFSLSGDHAGYFAVSNVDNVLSLTLNSQIPEEIIQVNKFLVLEILARRERAVSTTTSIVIDVITEDSILPVFSQPYYQGTYTMGSGLVFEETIYLSEGYDDTVNFELEGELSAWFALVANGNDVTIVLSSAIPTEVAENYRQLLFTIIATKPETDGGRTAISIDLPDEASRSVLQFEQSSYVGRLQNDVLQLEQIIVVGEDYDSLNFTMLGDYASFFELQPSGNTITLQLANQIPEEVIAANYYLLLTIEVFGSNDVSAHTTVVIELISERNVDMTPIFDQAYYTGLYSEAGGLIFEQSIQLIQGFDDNVVFTLQGDDSSWFSITQSGNSVSLSVADTTLSDVTDRNHLIFSIVANRPETAAGMAAIIVSLADLSTASSLQFSQVNYVGSIENGNVSLEAISLAAGYSGEVTFALEGEYSDHFAITDQNNTVSLILVSELPSVVSNTLLVFIIQAQADLAVAQATVVLKIINNLDAGILPLNFEETYYSGSYSEIDGLSFDHIIRLIDGFDESVTFYLEGDHSQWFSLQQSEDTVTLSLASEISTETVLNNFNLIFTIVAQRSDGHEARSAIIINISNGEISGTVLRFEQTSYLGTVEANSVSLNPIIVSEGYNDQVFFTMTGELASYFIVTNQDAVITVSVFNEIPENVLNDNRIIILELQASGTETTSAYTTIVLESLVTENVEVPLIFSETYYTGEYTELLGLSFSNQISLIQGYDDTVLFNLEGDYSEWFNITQNGNSVELLLITPLPSATLANNNYIILTIAALTTGGTSARASVVISLIDEVSSEVVLRFEKINYLGNIENNVATLEPVYLLEGFEEGITFNLLGDQSEYFSIATNEATVFISLLNNLPVSTFADHTIIMLDLEASREGSVSGYATIIFQVTSEDSETISDPLIFSEAYYTGYYTAAEGLNFDSIITLSAGYDVNVTFTLEGEFAQWFSLIQSDNILTLTLSSTIGSDILSNYQQLIFSVVAEKVGSTTGRAVIIISLLDDNTSATILRFESNSYVGTLSNEILELETIVLSEGFNDDVVFSLTGDLATYFSITHQDSTVSIDLSTPIPQEVQLSNRFLLLEIQASHSRSITAYATVILELISDADNETNVANQLVFEEAFYTGYYTETQGLVFGSVISLANGYEDDTVFTLEGDNSQWFTLIQINNAAVLTLSNPIDTAVIANNQHIIFTVVAQSGTSIARTAVVISLTDDLSDAVVLRFENNAYRGTTTNNVVDLETIVLSEGYSDNIVFLLRGEFASYFSFTTQGAEIVITVPNTIPNEVILANNIIVLEMEATGSQVLPAHATIVLEVVSDEPDVTDQIQNLLFEQPFYEGSYTEAEGLNFESVITLSQGYDEDVIFVLEGEYSQWFAISQTNNTASLILLYPITSAVVANNQQIIFTISAQKIGSDSAIATIVISTLDDYNDPLVLVFERNSYVGSINTNALSLESIVLIEGFNDNVTFTLLGELATYFSITSEGSIVTVALVAEIPEQVLFENQILILDLQASAPQTISAYATIVLEITTAVEEEELGDVISFGEPYYVGSYSELDGFVFESAITLSGGIDQDVNFSLEGDYAHLFLLVLLENSVSLTVPSEIPPEVLINNQQLILVIIAQNSGNYQAKSTIIVTIDYGSSSTIVLRFSEVNYRGYIESNEIILDTIILSEGYSEDISFALDGDLANNFQLANIASSITIALLEPISNGVLQENTFIILEVTASGPQAISAYSTIILETQTTTDDNIINAPVFSQAYYIGTYIEGQGLSIETVSLNQGYDDTVQFLLEGGYSERFSFEQTGNAIVLTLSDSLSDLSDDNLLFSVIARKPGYADVTTAVFVTIERDSTSQVEASFGSALYSGILEADEVQHEPITVTGYNGTDIGILGVHAEMFVASATAGAVVVQAAGSVTLPADTHHVALELTAGDASTALVLDVYHSDEVTSPTVLFESASYEIRVDVTQTGLVGRVQAAADTGERVAYTLLVDSAHLQERLSVDSEGGLYLSAPASSGVYMFEVVASTISTQVSATTTVQLTVDAITVCGADGPVVPPLIILDRDEESAHESLVTLDGSEFEGCYYTLSNKWPLDQDWLYVDERGLHARSIDREHESIAFMALSQVQVELILQCDSDDTTTRSKRSTDSRLDWLGPYDYGFNNWILTETILYNSRRSYVNLIVNDINDNFPIFDGKENEPIAVGYPTQDLVDVIMPRALVQLKATDADVGENAALVYWSSEPQLAVSASTGDVHVRGSIPEDETRLVVHATDRNAAVDGLTGSIEIMVRHLTEDHIAVVTIRDSFLDDEVSILANLSNALGYDVKVLSSVVISDEEEVTDIINVRTRTKRQLVEVGGVSLLMYMYGMVEREPVDVSILTSDISNLAIASVAIASSLSLQDYLESQQIVVVQTGRDTALLVSTIVLSIILFILIVLIGVWFYLKWRKQNYTQFSDVNSVASRNESIDTSIPKPDTLTRPKINIEELKRSERRLQEMLNAPVNEAPVEAVLNKDISGETKIEVPSVPIVIQSIDKLKDANESDDDEFGEKKLKARRKSVVTFNENVERIIHVEDTSADTDSIADYEVEKL